MHGKHASGGSHHVRRRLSGESLRRQAGLKQRALGGSAGAHRPTVAPVYRVAGVEQRCLGGGGGYLRERPTDVLLYEDVPDPKSPNGCLLIATPPPPGERRRAALGRRCVDLLSRCDANRARLTERPASRGHESWGPSAEQRARSQGLGGSQPRASRITSGYTGSIPNVAVRARLPRARRLAARPFAGSSPRRW